MSVSTLGKKIAADAKNIRCGNYCGFSAPTAYEVGNHMRDDCTVWRAPTANGSGPPANRVLDEAR